MENQIPPTEQPACDILGRKRYTRAQREKLLEAFKRSELSQTKFCRSHGIELTTFNTWLRSKQKLNAKSKKSKNTGKFKQVMVFNNDEVWRESQLSDRILCTRIKLANGSELMVEFGSVAQIAQFLQAFSERTYRC